MREGWRGQGRVENPAKGRMSEGGRKDVLLTEHTPKAATEHGTLLWNVRRAIGHGLCV